MDAAFYTQNRKNIIKLLEGKPFAVAAHKLVQKSADQDYEFFQDSNFYYLTGIETPDCLLVLDAQGESYLFIPEVTEFHATWIGEGLSVASAQALSGIRNVFTTNEIPKMLPDLLKGNTAMPYPDRKIGDGFRLNRSHDWLHKTLKRYGVKKPVDAQDVFAQLRMVKSKQEVALLDSLARLSKKTLNEVIAMAKPGMHEFELEAEITKSFRMANTRHGYSPIVAAGKNSCILHYGENSSRVANNSVVLIDVGAEKHHYSADVTRTFVCGSNHKAQEVIDTVQSVQSAVIEYIKPGQTMREIEHFTRTVLLKELVSLGYLAKKSTVKDTITYMPHSFGHHLGLDVHDSYIADTPLTENMVITVEPGIYLCGESIGVRIEDDIVLTKNGARILG